VTYNWTYSGTGGTINNGTTNSITLDLSGIATSGTLSVTATNACGTSSASTAAITVNSGTPQPGAFTASSATVCQGQSGVVYTVPNVAGTTYSWSYTGSDVIINGNTNSINIDFGMAATSGTLSVVANNGSGASTPRTMAITVNQVATQPSAISGPSTVSAGQTSIVYAVSNQSGVTFNWTYTGSGVTIVAGQGTNFITVDFGTAATSGNLRVTATGGACGGSSLPTILTVNVLPPLSVDGNEGVSYSLNVYPNPATSFATVEMNVKNAGKVDLGVYDLLGTEVKVLLKNEMLLSDTYTFSIDDLAYGVYLVKAKSGDETKVVKLIKH
jgi:PKD-like domain/Secretion system C-terminal sorting domain